MQVEPISGYDKFEQTTNIDGVFKFDRLYPACEYEVIVTAGKYLSPVKVKTVSSHEGTIKPKILPPIELRYRIDNPEVLIDTKKGVMWVKNANLVGKGLSWSQATAWVNDLVYAGYANWRLPSKEEWDDFVAMINDIKKFDGPLSQLGFYNTQDSDYWSSSSQTTYTESGSSYDLAWAVNIQNRDVRKCAKYYEFYLWPVRNITNQQN
jgi:hypothetical protein